MNTHNTLPPRSGRRRIALGILSLLSAATVAANAQMAASVNLAGKGISHGKSITVTSGESKISPSKLYTYTISGKVRGSGGDWAILLPGTTTLTINQLFPNNISLLSGEKANTAGTLPFQLLSQTFQGTGTISGKKIKMSLKLTAGIDAAGQLSVKITDVSLQKKVSPTRYVPMTGSLVFGRGTKLSVSTAPIVEFKATGQGSFAETAGFAEVTVWRLGNTRKTASVTYQTANGTNANANLNALAGTDYDTSTGTYTWKPGETAEKKIKVPLLVGTDKRGRREFYINLVSVGAGTVLGSKTQNKVVISADP